MSNFQKRYSVINCALKQAKGKINFLFMNKYCKGGAKMKRKKKIRRKTDKSGDRIKFNE